MRFERLPSWIGSGRQIFDLIEPSGDITYDWVPDLVTRVASTGKLRIYPMTRTFGFLWRLSETADWRGAGASPASVPSTATRTATLSHCAPTDLSVSTAARGPACSTGTTRP